MDPEKLTQAQLHSLFAPSTWQGLSIHTRRDICQEVANRYASAHGTAPCRVTMAPMEGATYGYHQGGIITLNQYILGSGKFLTRDLDSQGIPCYREHDAPGGSWQVLETVYHEANHGLQDAQGRDPFTYVEPETDYDLYRIQPCEAEAFAEGQSRTLEAIQESGVRDSDTSAYIQTVKANNYYSHLEEARENYRDPDIENTLAQVIRDRDTGSLPQVQSDSYRQLDALLDSQTQAALFPDGGDLRPCSGPQASSAPEASCPAPEASAQALGME